MTDQQFNELLSHFLDGSLPEDHLASILALEPNRAAQTRQELELVDLIEQCVKPERSYQAFRDGLETRVCAKRSEDAFIEALIPKLREIDERMAVEATEVVEKEQIAAKIVRFPFIRRVWAGGLAAAAAVALLLSIPVMMINQASAGFATVGQTENAVWEKTSEPIEWARGSTVMPGEPVRLRAGKARIDFDNGNRLTIEGPAEIHLVSASEAQLISGKLVATVEPGNDPFIIHTPDVNFELDGASTAIRIKENSTEATQLSLEGEAFAFQTNDKANGNVIGAGQSIVFKPNHGIDHASSDVKSYHDHLPLLSGIESYSQPIQFALEGSMLGSEPAPPGVMQVVMEHFKLTLPKGFEFDFVSGDEFDFGPMRLNSPKAVRSYRLEVESFQVASAEFDQGFINGFITFDSPILGVSTTAESLLESDALNQVDGSDALAAFGFLPDERGLEDGDRIQILDGGRTLGFRIKVADRNTLAQLRVFVAVK
ncbi:MAG: hypothetical protein ACI8UO_005479 [Verrucomicrobiales bacterium]|jgi:hypothetical protein